MAIIENIIVNKSAFDCYALARNEPDSVGRQ